MTRWLGLVSLLALVACPAVPVASDGGPPEDGGAPDGGAADGGWAGDGGSDAGADGGLDGGVGDGGAPGPFDAGPEPQTVLEPVPGELTLVQLDLPPGLTARMGEAAVIIGPDGTLVLVDVGNSSHAAEVRAEVRHLNTEVLTPAHGFPVRGPLQVDWILITHYHADHLGALEALLTPGPDALQLTRGLVTRGNVDLGQGINTSDWEALCRLTSGTAASRSRPLCVATPAAAGCTFASLGGTFPATSCPGLLAGDLEVTGDEGQAGFISLGGGARLLLLAADGFVSDGATVTQAPAFGVTDTNEENARSLAGLLEYGAFRAHFGGDLTGSGAATEPDIESVLAQHAGPAFWAPLGVDVVHVHHHARRTSSNATLVQALAPADGRTRNAVAGINGAYLGSPHQQVLDAWGNGGRLGQGLFWVTDTALGGGSHQVLLDASANVVVQTVLHGAGYRVQAARSTPLTHTYEAVRR